MFDDTAGRDALVSSALTKRCKVMRPCVLALNPGSVALSLETGGVPPRAGLMACRGFRVTVEPGWPGSQSWAFDIVPACFPLLW